MTNYKKQLVSVIAAGTVLLQLAGPAFASDTIQITGNGAGSVNATSVAQSNTTSVSQSNTANVTNNVTTNANTGNNNANYNTGGDVLVKTGAASTTTDVTNTLNSNAAQVAGCNCGSDTDVTISGNGAKSQNQVGLEQSNATAVGQANQANVANNVNSNANTGGNDAKLNTGGDVLVNTGTATSNATVSTTANSNSAVVGGGAAGAVAPTASFKIVGNGAGSNNWITAGLGDSTTVQQANSANVTNNVQSNAKTGDNDANYNTGGDVAVVTQAAMAGATVDNMVNFNYANVDCGCTWDLLAKIDGNGATPNYWDPTQDSITLALDNANLTGQANADNQANNVNANAKTGYNDANLNTGTVLGSDDPAVISGAATDITGVSNAGNVNTVGTSPIVLPLPGGNNVGVSFNMQALLAFFGLSM